VRRDPHQSSTPAAAAATAHWEVLGTSVVLRVLDPLWLPRTSVILTRELDALDRACSRFRPDSDLCRVNARAGGRPVPVAPLLTEALLVALRAAEVTDGDVDPTVGAALVLAGYDRDWQLLEPAPGDHAESSLEYDPWPVPPVVSVWLRSGYTTVELDTVLHTVRVPRGVVLDVGATAKAWAADRAAHAIHAVCGCGVLVSLGGDLATAGAAPAGGWRVHVTDDHRAGHLAPGQTVTIDSGGLATSSTTVRRWRHAGATAHHLIDPATGSPVRGPWRTVSVAAATCVDANTAATAALVRQAHAPAWLDQLGLPARLVAHDGAVLRLGNWPEDPVAHRRTVRTPRGASASPTSTPVRLGSSQTRGAPARHSPRSPAGERTVTHGGPPDAPTRATTTDRRSDAISISTSARQLGAVPTHADDPL
jgi:thiamine biosynthesis lipoprotein